MLHKLLEDDEIDNLNDYQQKICVKYNNCKECPAYYVEDLPFDVDDDLSVYQGYCYIDVFGKE